MTFRQMQQSRRSSRRRGFTLIEVLSTLLLMAIVIPVIMRGITYAQKAADSGRHRAEAAGLAQMEMATILATTSWQTSGSQSGDFSPDFPEYKWESQAAPWPGDTVGAGLDEIDLTVSWGSGNQHQSITLCTLAYPRNASATSSTSSTGSTATP
jgi:prepilin-type N-terminal cleavage/methylation domain-containing protein